MANPVTWDDVKPGAIIRYQHLSRARRLAGKPLTVRTGRIENVYPPEPGVRRGQIVVSALNKDGTVNDRLGRFTVGIDFIVSVTEVQYRIVYTIIRDQGGVEAEIGFGSSGSSASIDAAAYEMESAIQNRQWETSAGMPDPREVDRRDDDE